MKLKGFTAAASLLAALNAPLALADSGGYGHMGDWFPGMGGHWMFGLFWLILLGVVVVFALRWMGGGNSSPGAPTAMEILKQRYARGEIDEEEFQRTRRELEG